MPVSSVAPSYPEIAGISDLVVRCAVWEPLVLDCEAEPLNVGWAGYGDRTIQVEGEFGGAKLFIEGSNDYFVSDEAHWHRMRDDEGLDLDIREPGIFSCGIAVATLRPRLIGGSEVTRLSVVLFMRRTSR